MEVPGEWKTALRNDLEADPPILGAMALGGQQGPVGPAGPAGPQGPPGPGVPVGGTPGQVLTKQSITDYDTFWTATVAADKNYVHTQGTLSATWTVVHNLNKYAGVEVVDSGDTVIIPNIHYDSLNQMTLTFGTATSGKAFCN